MENVQELSKNTHVHIAELLVVSPQDESVTLPDCPQCTNLGPDTMSRQFITIMQCRLDLLLSFEM